MSRSWKMGVTLMVLAAAFFAQSRFQAAPEQHARASHNASAAFPPVWISETTHAVYRVQISGSVLRAEQVNTPPEVAKQGAYVRTEAHEAGGKWVGKSQVYAKITLAPGGKSQQSNWCHLEANIEFLTLTPERITGRSEAPLQMDISKCRILKKEWKDFVWIPAK